MGAPKRSSQDSSDRGWMSKLASPFRGNAGRYLAVLAIGLLAVAATTYAWQRWGQLVVASVDGSLAIGDFNVPAQPDWIRVDIKEEVFRDGSLAALNYLDQELTCKVHRAFMMHAWVAKVDRVTKSPSREINVKLSYRRPVAWVEIPNRDSPSQQDRILPIDSQAVVLDPQELRAGQSDLLRVSISELPDFGPKGTPWGDSRLLGAAKLASLLHDCWRELGIFRIRGLSTLDSRREGAVYELVTLDQQRIIWGSAPGSELPREPKAAEKLEWLKQIGSDGHLNSPHDDLRLPYAPRGAQRTARRPSGQFD